MTDRHLAIARTLIEGLIAILLGAILVTQQSAAKETRLELTQADITAAVEVALGTSRATASSPSISSQLTSIEHGLYLVCAAARGYDADRIGSAWVIPGCD